jgi:hypothetical protein
LAGVAGDRSRINATTAAAITTTTTPTITPILEILDISD